MEQLALIITYLIVEASPFLLKRYTRIYSEGDSFAVEGMQS